jgi:hypothetical protein
MASETFIIQNFSSEPAQINSIEFTNPQGVQHTANLSQFGGNLAGQTNYTGSSGALTLTKKYISDSKSQTAGFKSYEEFATVTANFQSFNTVTNVLTFSSPSGAIGQGWAITGGGFTNQSVVSVNNVNFTLIPSSAPTPVIGNPIITFTNNIAPLRKLTITRNDKIEAGWILNSNPTGFTLDQTVVQVLTITELSTELIVSSNPDSPLIANQAITFISPASDIELEVDSVDGIIPGFVASGNGYTGQTVLGLLTNPPRLRMSDYPPGNPVFLGNIVFTDTNPIGLIPANSSIEFSIDYSQTRNSPSTLNAQMVIDATLGGDTVIKTIDNSIVISQAPAENPNTNFNPDGGAGETAPGAVTDGGSSSGSNWNWLPIVVFIFTGWFW